jgi:hypothetical protein
VGIEVRKSLSGSTEGEDGHPCLSCLPIRVGFS